MTAENVSPIEIDFNDSLALTSHQNMSRLPTEL